MVISRRARGVPAVVGVLVSLAVFSIAGPAWAHGEEGEAVAVDLVEQALAIVVNSPGAMGEAQERVEEALAAEPADLEGLEVEALKLAVAAMEVGNAHAAEDALVEALGFEPHPGEAAASAEEEAENVLATPETEHGLTARLEGGFKSPGVGALVLAVVLAGAGTWFLRRKETTS